ncbi:MAG: endonuclease III [Thermodesulfobacteriota bacterium]|nr:endonuclease III [Thermodesulfobacteriota bacterium]
MSKKQSATSNPPKPPDNGSRPRSNRAQFNIDHFVGTIKRHYRSWNAPVVTLIASHGGGPFEVLVTTILSLRTKDEVTAKAARRILSKANTPARMLALDEKAIEKLIYPVGFYPTKARQLRRISRILIEQYDSRVPDTIDALLEFPGVGRKTANLVLVEGFGQEAICVDTHVHRISNRIGYVHTRTPEKTEFALREKLPRKYWVQYNELLVAFGQVLCRPISPWCSRCPVAHMCPRVAVKKSR